MRRALAAALAALAAAGLCGALAPAASGHAAFTGASPPPGQRVDEAPPRVSLSFTEPLRRELSEAALVDARGREVPAGLSVRGRRMTLTPRRELGRGPYLVRWRTVSTQDAHPLEGSFGFGVRAAAAAGAGSVEESPLAGEGWAQALTRGLLYCALLLFAGALLCRALLGREWPLERSGGHGPPDRPSTREPVAPEPGGGVATLARPATAPAAVPPADGVRRRADAVVVDAGLAATALAAVAAVVDAVDAAGGASLEGVRAYLLSGTPGIARIALVALLAGALVLARRAPRAAALAALAGLGCVVASGHANSADARGLAVAADWTHLVAGAVWLGGAATLLAAWGPGLRGDRERGAMARAALSRFGRVALPAFAAVVVAGTVNAVVELSSPSDLWDTAYGRVLAVKVALVAGAAAAAYAHVRARRGASLERAAAPDRQFAPLTLEIGFGAAIALVAGLLVAFPLPPRQLDAAVDAATAIPACDPCPLPAARPGELSVAGPAGSHVVAAWLRRQRGGLTGTIRTLDSRGRPGRGAIEVPGAGTRPCGPGCARFRATPAPAVLRVHVADRGRTYAAALPATWRPGATNRARRLLARAERAMRGLRSVREVEVVSSGPGMRAVTRYRLQAPDRMAFVTGRGVRTVQIGRTQWVRLPGTPWRRSAIAGGVPLRTRAWFRWTPYARGIQVLAQRGATVELALADPATPVWMRLVVDRRTGRVLRERIAARARFIARRFHAFDAPLEIRAPRGAVDAG